MPGRRSPTLLRDTPPFLLFSASDAPGAPAFLGQVFTLQSAEGEWLAERRAPPTLSTDLEHARASLPPSWRSVWDAVAPSLAVLFSPPAVPVHRLFFAERDCTQYRKMLQRRALRRPVGAPPVVTAANAPHADASAALPHAAPCSVPLSFALAAAAAAPQEHQWVPDARDATVARRIIERRRRAQRKREAGARRSSGASGAPGEDAAAVAAALAAPGCCPVFSAGSMLVALPTRPGASLSMFRPWFFSAEQLERVVSWAVDATARRAVALRAAERRASVAAAFSALRVAAASARGPASPAAGAAMPPPSAADASDDPTDALEDGGVEEDDELLRDYMRELGGMSASAADDAVTRAAAAAPNPHASPLPPFGGGDGAVLLLSMAALGAAAAAPFGDVLDHALAATRVGRRLLVTGSWRHPGRGEDIAVETFERVAGWSLYGQPTAHARSRLVAADVGEAGSGTPAASDSGEEPDTAPRPLFVADLGLEQLSALLR